MSTDKFHKSQIIDVNFSHLIIKYMKISSFLKDVLKGLVNKIKLLRSCLKRKIINDFFLT